MESANGEENGAVKHNVDSRKRSREGEEERTEGENGGENGSTETRKRSRESLESAGESVVLTEQEAAVYDRQIRIWGAEAQRRLSKGRVLVVGISGVIAETCKNIVLAGIGSLTLMDDSPVTVETAFTNFLIYSDETDREETRSIAAVCTESLREYNPMVAISVDRGSIADKPGEYFDNFDAVILDKASLSIKKHVNDVCRSRPQSVAFYAVDCRYSCASFFVDLQTVTYTLKKNADAKATKNSMAMISLKDADTDSTQNTKIFCSLKESLAVRLDSLPKRTSIMLFASRIVDEFELQENRRPGQLSSNDLTALLDFGKHYLSSQGLNLAKPVEKLLQKIANAGWTELPPVSAITGGILGQEIIKALSGKGEPLRNYFFFDTTDGKGIIEDVSPVAPLPPLPKMKSKRVHGVVPQAIEL